MSITDVRDFVFTVHCDHCHGSFVGDFVAVKRKIKIFAANKFTF